MYVCSEGLLCMYVVSACCVQYGTRKRLRSVLLARHMYDCIVSNYAGIHGVNTIERRYGINYRV